MNIMENAVQLIKNSENITILGGKNSRGDIFACVSVLADFLKNLNKKTAGVIFSSDFEAPDFFTLKDLVNHSIDETLPYILSINKNDAEISEVAFDDSGQAYLLELYVKKGDLNLSNIKIEKKEFKPDLIITIGIADRSDIIESEPKYSQIFFDTPIINIDNKVDNTKYGQVNLVYLTKSSISEIVFDLLRTIDELSLSPAHTTSLLGGIIMETKNLISNKTNPSTFETVARLIERGADYKMVVEKLYQTKSFSVLKLTGFLLSKLNINKDLPICWVALPYLNTSQNSFSLKDLPMALEEIENNFFPGFIIAAFWEKEDKSVTAIITWRDRERLISISKLIKDSILKQNFLIFNTSDDLNQIANKTIELLQKQI
jgi:nanoRNase/pAp phosphatase (c-di-AMP/oligoRNAs hydrolase)